MKESNARKAALHALERCRRDGAWSGSSIDGEIKRFSLEGRDAALASTLCLGVLENRSLCDHYISCFCNIGLSRLEPKVLDILRLGVYQIAFMDRIPNSAAVNESVELCKGEKMTRAVGLVTAVLRKIAVNSDNLPQPEGEGSGEYLSLMYSHPLWLANRLIEEKGYAFTEAFFQANNTNPKLDIQINTLKISAGEYLKLLGEEYEYRESGVRLNGGNPAELPGFDDGMIYVQDRAAKMTCLIADARPGMCVLDACAAPGGKSFSSAILMENRGSIISCDIHEKKLSLIKSGAERLGIDIISPTAADGSKFREDFKDRFDLVIADVPCSGIGVIRKKPEIRYKNENDILRLPEIQKSIIDNASRYVRPGGCLVYSTCTVLADENERIVERFLSEHGNYEAVDFSVDGINSENGMHTFWPNVDGTDGFFAAKLRRIK